MSSFLELTEKPALVTTKILDYFVYVINRGPDLKDKIPYQLALRKEQAKGIASLKVPSA